MSTAKTLAQKLRKRIRDARYRANNCGAVQRRIREWKRRNYSIGQVVGEIAGEILARMEHG